MSNVLQKHESHKKNNYYISNCLYRGLHRLSVTVSLSFNIPVFFFFFLEKPGQPVVSVTSLKARTATVTWSYSPGANEFPTSFTVQYQNRTFSDILSLKPGNSLSTVLTHLKPFADYNVTVKASSFLGDGSSTRNIKTLAARMWIV